MASAAFRRSARAAETAGVWLSLITVTSSSFSEPHRLVPERADVVSRSNTFKAYPGRVALPRDTDDGTLDGYIRLDDVERTLADALRGANAPPAVLVEIVRSGAPDVVEFAHSSLELRDITITETLELSAVVGLADHRTEPMPAGAMTPAHFPEGF